MCLIPGAWLLFPKQRRPSVWPSARVWRVLTWPPHPLLPDLRFSFRYLLERPQQFCSSNPRKVPAGCKAWGAEGPLPLGRWVWMG